MQYLTGILLVGCCLALGEKISGEPLQLTKNPTGSVSAHVLDPPAVTLRLFTVAIQSIIETILPSTFQNPKDLACKMTEVSPVRIRSGEQAISSVCHVCKESLKDKVCQTYDGKLYDTRCFATVCATRCDSCEKPIRGKSVQDNNQCYHTRCYQCYLCHKTLQGVPHFTAENKMRLCVPCLTR